MLSQLAFSVAESGALHLSALVKPDGRFVYRYTADGREAPGYNLLRHCGTVWAMADVADGQPHLHSVAVMSQRALDWILENRLQRYKDTSCIVGKGNLAKLGGAGLAMLACVGVARVSGEESYLDTAHQLGRFILLLKREDGDFEHKISTDTGEVQDFRSGYYTGEALFGLARLNTVRRDAERESAILDSLDRLAARDYGVEEQSHWMLYALAEAALIPGAEAQLDYGARIAEGIVSKSGYRERMESTPIACRTEALLAFLRLAETAGRPDHPLRPKVVEAIEMNLALQMRWRYPTGAFAKGDKTRDVQIDYVQHNISGFLGFSRLVGPDGLMAGGGA